MEKEFVPYELAVKLKELGFDELCVGRYFKVFNEKPIFIYNYSPSNENNDIITIAPLWQQAFDWFRENKGLHACIKFNGSESYYWWINAFFPFRLDINSIDDYEFSDFESARQSCLEKLIELVTEKK